MSYQPWVRRPKMTGQSLGPGLLATGSTEKLLLNPSLFCRPSKQKRPSTPHSTPTLSLSLSISLSLSRYPEYGTVAPSQQLGGVIMGRLVHCQETCSHMKDFKESVGTVFRNALWRGYSRRLVQSVWSRFLFQRWHATDIRVKELRVWFGRVWNYLTKNGRPDPSKAAPNLGSSPDSRFLQVFGEQQAAAGRVPQVQSRAPVRAGEHLCRWRKILKNHIRKKPPSHRVQPNPKWQ